MKNFLWMLNSKKKKREDRRQDVWGGGQREGKNQISFKESREKTSLLKKWAENGFKRTFKRTSPVNTLEGRKEERVCRRINVKALQDSDSVRWGYNTTPRQIHHFSSKLSPSSSSSSLYRKNVRWGILNSYPSDALKKRKMKELDVPQYFRRWAGEWR